MKTICVFTYGYLPSHPQVVQKLEEVLSDAHPKVQAAASGALTNVGLVIHNPEVKSLVPDLIAAIQKPGQSVKAVLEMLLATTFVNTIDSPSLALIVRVIYRGLRDRQGDIKKKAARIVGNMGSLINEPRDLEPYVDLLLEPLKQALLDPLPEVRATCARAIGALVKGEGLIVG